ncbi:MAG TPA: hypothetical protein VGI73_01970 [Solirubrobacterales bacterium]
MALACVPAAEPTTLSTSLSGESKSGASITVLEGTKVKDQGTLEGKNAAKATGKISYAVYKDSLCKELVTKAGESEFKEGKVPASEEKTLEAGKVYYWQAHYGGDSLDGESTSSCGSEVLSVKAATSISTSLSGEAKSGESITVLEGTKVKDKATLSGTNSSSATGKIEFKVYKDSECKELATEAGKPSVSGGSAESEEKTLTAGAVYYWRAHYEGDSLHQESTSSCTEVLTVKAATSISTSLSGGEKSGETITVPAGTKVKDKATLAGTGIGSATGTVTYSVYADSECKELVTSAGEVTVTAGSAPSSEEKTLEAGRTYYWRASYGGDSLHQAATGACGAEVEHVKAAVSLSTSLSGEAKSGETITVLEGAKVKDQATLSGTNSGKATGTVEYFVYADAGCKEPVAEAGEASVAGGIAGDSESLELEGGATYHWQAVYSGDGNHEPATSPCTEVATVRAATSLATLLHAEGEEGEELTIAAGAGVRDEAVLGGSKAETATGTVEFALYEDSSCEELAEGAGEITLDGESIPLSEEVAPAGGVYYWQAVYSGDTLHQAATSPCDEILVVDSPTALETELIGEGQEGTEITVAEGASVHDTATLSGAKAAEATGTVRYEVFSDPECTELVEAAGEVSVAAGTVPPSSEVPLEPGIYFWQASYSGDGVNHASVSPCGSEGAVVLPQLTTELSDGEASEPEIQVVEGTGVTDTATLHGPHAAEATGTVEYFVYADEKCEELVEAAGEVTVAGATAPPSEELHLPAGSYLWQAEYSGDGKNPPAVSECGDEALSVQTSTSVTTTLSGGEEEGEEIEVEQGTAVSDQASLSGANAGGANGIVSYSVYADPECTELVALAGQVEAEGGVVPPSEEQTLPIGTYYWQAEYNGDQKNQGAESACGSEVEAVWGPITSEQTSGEESADFLEVTEGAGVTDAVELHGPHAAEATGTVTYFVYEDSQCEDLIDEAGEVAVAGPEVEPSDEEVLEGGIYFWQAEYSGGGGNPPAVSECAEEELVVAPPLSKYAALGDSFSSGLGAGPGSYYAPTVVLPNGNQCYRSGKGWPGLTAKAFYGKEVLKEEEVFKQQPDSFIFRACQGSTIANLWASAVPPNPKSGRYDEETIEGANKKVFETPSQDLWLSKPGGTLTNPVVPNREIKLVTLTIGGNDAKFAQIARACVEGSRAFGNKQTACFDAITSEGGPGIAAVEAKLPALLAHIRASAPNAEIRIPYYPQLVDATKNPIKVGTFFGAQLTISNVIQVPWAMTPAQALEAFVKRLNQAIQKKVTAAFKAGVPVKTVPASEGALKGHLLGDAEAVGNASLWVNLFYDTARLPESFHPTDCGYIAMANAFLNAWAKPKAMPPALC